MSKVWPAALRVMVGAAMVSALICPRGACAQSPELQNDPRSLQQPSEDPNEPPPDEPAYQGNDVRPEENAPDINQGGDPQPNDTDPGAPPQDPQNYDQRGVM